MLLALVVAAAAGRRPKMLEQLYASCEALDVGPKPIEPVELEQGHKLVRYGNKWIKAFDAGPVERRYHARFDAEQRLHGMRFAGEPVLCMGARLGGEVRALTRLGALAIGVDLNPGFRNPHVLWGDGLRLQFAERTFRYVYTNVLDHVPRQRIPDFIAQASRVLKPGGVLIVDMDAHDPDGFARTRAQQVRDSVERSLADAGWALRRRPFCRTEAEWRGPAGRENATCVLGNPTVDGGFDPAGGVSIVASRPALEGR